MKQRLFIFLILVHFVFAVSCRKSKDHSSIDSSSSSIPVLQQPNGLSPLASLMEDMYHTGLDAKKALIKNKPASITLDYRKILSAKPTDESMTDFPEFESIGKSYIEAMDSLKYSSSPSGRLAAYRSMVSTCRACHSLTCPGPMVRFKKLNLPSNLNP